LKGLEVGGSYRFRESPVIGYIASPAEDHFSFFPYTQNAQLDFRASDLNRPVLGNTREDYDMFFSYRGRIKDHARYTVRLNIRNLFNDTSVIQQRADSTGRTVVYTFNPPRSIVLSLDWRF
jgi:outer membrane receptor protein involved in Fe transport